MHRVRRETRDGMLEVSHYERLGISPRTYSICVYSEAAEEKDTRWPDKHKLRSLINMNHLQPNTSHCINIAGGRGLVDVWRGDELIS
jgi:hypothetical protein